MMEAIVWFLIGAAWFWLMLYGCFIWLTRHHGKRAAARANFERRIEQFALRRRTAWH